MKEIGVAVGLFVLFMRWFIRLTGKWRINKKAGEKGWSALIPVYAGIVQYRISWKWQIFFFQRGAVILSFFAFCQIAIYYLIEYVKEYQTEYIRYDIIDVLTYEKNEIIGLGVLGVIFLFVAAILHKIQVYKTARTFGKKEGTSVILSIVPTLMYVMVGYGPCKYILYDTETNNADHQDDSKREDLAYECENTILQCLAPFKIKKGEEVINIERDSLWENMKTLSPKGKIQIRNIESDQLLFVSKQAIEDRFKEITYALCDR